MREKYESLSAAVLKDLAKQVKKEIIVVCGTNGKTTTNNLLYTLLKSRGYSVVGNLVGANMLPGIACSFIDHASIFGKLKADYATIECDEASLRRIVPHLTPNKVVITNLFRDQVDRFVELENTVEGLVSMPDMLDDYYIYDDKTKTLTGERKGKIYRIGDRVKVTLIKADKESRRIDFACGKIR